MAASLWKENHRDENCDENICALRFLLHFHNNNKTWFSGTALVACDFNWLAVLICVCSVLVKMHDNKYSVKYHRFVGHCPLGADRIAALFIMEKHYGCV